MRNYASAILVAACLLLVSLPAAASYGIYVGRQLTADGSVYLGGSGDEVSSHWLEIIPARQHAADATITVGVDATAVLPGELTEIPQVPRTARYITMNYSEYEGFPPPLTNGGLNEHGVAARDIWSDSRPELIALTPNPQRGPNYSDLSRIVMERATSAEEAVMIAGDLINRYGYSSYGGNSHLFADAKEGWVLIEYAGGKGLWIARRLGQDEVFMSYPGYIGEIPLDYQQHPDYHGSDNFVDFAVEQGWFDPDGERPFIADEVYGTSLIRYPRAEMEAELRAAAPITLRKMLNAVRDRRIAKDSTGYGQVAVLRNDVRRELRTLWVAPTGSVTAPFIPWRIGVTSVPPEYGKHRYLTKGESRRFLTEDWQIQEASLFAGRLFKRLMYFTCDRPSKFLPEVTEALTGFEDRMIGEQADLETTTMVLYEAGQERLAAQALTRYAHTAAEEALELGAALLASIEARTRVLYGLRLPQTDEMSRLDYQMVSCTE
ncbi:MAG: C69 family dipeptidase [Woeseiaceae bacterium]|jgi:dipeptidase|nr:C69 family dipeptidase [Woeseiaceae bacterium]